MKKTKRDEELRNMLRPIKKNILNGEALKRYTNIPIDENMEEKINGTECVENEDKIKMSQNESPIFENDSNMINMNKRLSYSSFNSSHYDGSTKSKREIKLDLKSDHELRNSLRNGEKSLKDNDQVTNEINLNIIISNYKSQSGSGLEESTHNSSINMESETTLNGNSREYYYNKFSGIDDDQNILTRVKSVPLDRNEDFLDSKIIFHSNNYLTPFK